MSLSLETLAVVLALVYLVLVMRENIWCWAAALASTCIFIYIFYQADLYMECGLQFFYIAMAVYGWWQWRGGSHNEELAISRWPLKWHLVVIPAIVVMAFASGYLLSRYTSAAMPFIDSLTTWGSIVATYMVARKIFENWHYWFVIDSLSIYIYLSRGLQQTALLFALYLVLIVFGYVAWRKKLSTQTIAQ